MAFPVITPTAVHTPVLLEYTKEFLRINTNSGPGVSQAIIWIIKIGTIISITIYFTPNAALTVGFKKRYHPIKAPIAMLTTPFTTSP